MATGDILIFNYSNYVMIYYQKQRGRDVGVDGEVEFIIYRYVEIRSERGVVGIPPSPISAHPHASVRPCPLVPAGVLHPRLNKARVHGAPHLSIAPIMNALR
jgi:hypothetical protein